MRRYDAYLFDLYGTLVDIRTDENMPALWEGLAAFYSENGATWTAKALRTAYGQVCAREAEKNGNAYPEIDLASVFAALYEGRGIAPENALIRQTAWQFRAASTKHLRLYAGAKELLSTLRKDGIVVLLSNAQRLFTMPELELLGLSAAFDAIYISSDYGRKKPDPDFFHLPMETFGLDPKRCLMIGNDPVCDIAGAVQSGMDAYYIHSAISPRGAPSVVPEAMESQARMNLNRVRRILTREENGKKSRKEW